MAGSVQGHVAVRVQVDEAGSDDQAGAVDDARLAGHGEGADGDDAFALGWPGRRRHRVAGAVVQDGALEDDVRRDGRLGGRQEQTKQQRDQARHDRLADGLSESRYPWTAFQADQGGAGLTGGACLGRPAGQHFQQLAGLGGAGVLQHFHGPHLA